MKFQTASFLLMIGVSNAFGLEPSSSDLWEISNGTVIGSSSGFHPTAGASGGLFGLNGQAFAPENTYTLFRDGAPMGTTHFIEWATPGLVRLDRITLFAVGDGPNLGNGREFSSFRLLAKSEGSATFDLTLATFTPTNPYTFIDQSSYALLDQNITPAVSRLFRMEVVQVGATAFSGPRIRELDGFGVVVPEPSSMALLLVGGAFLFRRTACGNRAWPATRR